MKFENVVIRYYPVYDHFHDGCYPSLDGVLYHNLDEVFGKIGVYDIDYFFDNGGKIKWMDTKEDYEDWWMD